MLFYKVYFKKNSSGFNHVTDSLLILEKPIIGFCFQIFLCDFPVSFSYVFLSLRL